MANISYLDSGEESAQWGGSNFVTFAENNADGAFITGTDFLGNASGTIYRMCGVEMTKDNDTFGIVRKKREDGTQGGVNYSGREATLEFTIMAPPTNLIKQIFSKRLFTLGLYLTVKGSTSVAQGYLTRKYFNGRFVPAGWSDIAEGAQRTLTVQYVPESLESATTDPTGHGLQLFTTGAAILTALPTFSGLTDVV